MSSPGAAAAAAAAAAADAINSGSVLSNQDSCTISGLVARAQAQMQLIEQRAAAASARSQEQELPAAEVHPRGAPHKTWNRPIR